MLVLSSSEMSWVLLYLTQLHSGTDLGNVFITEPTKQILKQLSDKGEEVLFFPSSLRTDSLVHISHFSIIRQSDYVGGFSRFVFPELLFYT